MVDNQRQGNSLTANDGFTALYKMPKPSDAYVEVSKRLLAHEREGVAQVPDAAEAAGRAYETLFRTLAPIIGAAGAHALFARSVTLAKAEFPGLGKVIVPAEPAGSAPTVASYAVASLRELEPGAIAQASVGLLAVFLGLLTNFIGEPLVWQILQKAFPGLDRTQPKETTT